MSAILRFDDDLIGFLRDSNNATVGTAETVSEAEWRSELPKLRMYKRIAAQCLGRKVLESAQVKAAPEIVSSPLGHLAFLLRCCFSQYRCDMPRVKVKLAGPSGLAGRVRGRNGVWYMDIADKYARDPDVLLALVAHEVAHIVLFLRGMNLAVKSEDEELADATTILGGFGAMRLAAGHPRGYLRPDAIAHLALVRARMCGERFPGTDRGYLVDPAERRLDGLCGRHAVRAASPQLSVTSCVACGSRLGLPAPAGGAGARGVSPVCVSADGGDYRLRLKGPVSMDGVLSSC